MAPSSDHEFVTKTIAELTRLTAEARALDPARGHDTARRWAEIHAMLDDHLEQLRGETAEPVQAALLATYDTSTGDPHAIRCACRAGRYVRNHTLMCEWCDGPKRDDG